MRWLVFTPYVTPRLKYIFRFFAAVLQNEEPAFTTAKEEFVAYSGPRINYSPARTSSPELWVCPQGILTEKDLRPQPVGCFDWNGRKAFFRVEGDMGFDLFAAAFYLVSRYEEYLPHQLDQYGRYAHQQSLAFREGFLNQPLVNHWINEWGRLIMQHFPGTKAVPAPMTLLPTYDIDIAWSYLHKGFWRNLGGSLRAALKGDWRDISERLAVLRGKKKDPFDCFGWLHQLHEKYRLKPYYFFLVPPKRGRFDKNIDPRKKEMRYLIQDHVIRYPVGVHPSWKSGDDLSQLASEIALLSHLNGNPVLSSRQHYIRFRLPEGYRRLAEAGIRYDFSMGYGSINGFRASTSSTFNWFDLERDAETNLQIFPFCFMEANSYYEQKLTSTQASTEMRQYYRSVQAAGGYFIMIWHNSLLGTAPAFSGWREIYQQFIEEICNPGVAPA